MVLNKPIEDLLLAASFVKSVETGNHGADLELKLLAERIDAIAGQLSHATPRDSSESLGLARKA